MLSKTMYPGIVNSPRTETTAAIAADAVSITVLNGAALPAAPNIAMLGIPGETDVETILYTVKTGNVISGVTRGWQGTAKVWPSQTTVSRMFAEYDYEALRQNITELEGKKAGNRNILHNWDFSNPVNQRGLSTYSATGYTIDRWKVTNGATVNVVAGSNIRVSSTGGYAAFTQFIENPQQYAGKTVTFTVLCQKVSGGSVMVYAAANGNIELGAAAISSTKGVVSITFTMPSPSTELYVQLVCNTASAATYDLFAAKLEVGTVSTLLSDPPMDFGKELLACQRYYEKSMLYVKAPLSGTSGGWLSFRARNALVASTATAIPVAFRFIAQKRIPPTIVLLDSNNTTANAIRNSASGNIRTGCYAAGISENGFGYISVDNTSAVTAALDEMLEFHYTADAEL